MHSHGTTASSDDDSDSTTIDYYPVVRYGFDTPEGGKRQEVALRSIHDTIPSDAKYASPVYFLTEAEFQRYLDAEENPYAISGSNNIVKELQSVCEQAGRVLVPVHVESDELDFGGSDALPGETIVRWVSEFIRSELGVETESCRFYFSGNRSIHAHVPLVVTNTAMSELRERAETFNTENDAALDSSIYKRKSQFRLPGVEHQSTDSRKVEIEPPYSRIKIAQAIDEDRASDIDTYADLIQRVFAHTIESNTVVSGRTTEDQIAGLPKSVVESVFGERPVLSFTDGEKETAVQTPIVEQQHRPLDEEMAEMWDQYNEKEFSPYAKAGGQSLAVITVRGGPFVRPENNRRILLPAQIHAAIGRDGEFTVFHGNRPIQLSKPDADKRTYTPGEHLVLKGGGNNSSVIHSVDASTAFTTSYYLSDGGRQAAIQYLEGSEFDMGSEGPSTTTNRDSPLQSGEQKHTEPTEESEAAKLQRRAENGDVEASLTHMERWYVACRLLRVRGWDGAWNWFENQYGPEFEPNTTYRHVASAANSLRMSDQVPPKSAMLS
jgi:hypothetical protein